MKKTSRVSHHNGADRTQNEVIDSIGIEITKPAHYRYCPWASLARDSAQNFFYPVAIIWHVAISKIFNNAY